MVVSMKALLAVALLAAPPIDQMKNLERVRSDAE